jgi:hypothetical protein
MLPLLASLLITFGCLLILILIWTNDDWHPWDK